MIILALEFSSPIRGVALLRPCGPERPWQLAAAVSDQGSRECSALALMEECLRQAGVAPEAVTMVAVALGPGSYTGIRSSIALAQGWQLARGVQLRAVRSVDVLAAQAQAKGWLGEVWIALDAQRQDVYFTSYQLSAVRRDVLEPLRLMPEAEFRSRLAGASARRIGPEITRWDPDGLRLVPEAEMAGRLALESEAIPIAGLEPVYLRETAFVKVKPRRPLLG